MSSFPSVWRDLCWHTLRYAVTFCVTWILWHHCWQFASFVDLSMTCFQFSSYEPELFPGLIYRCHFVNLCGSFTLKIQFLSNIVRMVKPRIVLLIFVSGKVVLTGAKVIEGPCCCAWCIIVGFRCEQKSMKLLRISTQSWRTSKSSESWFCQPASHQYIGIFVSV